MPPNLHYFFNIEFFPAFSHSIFSLLSPIDFHSFPGASPLSKRLISSYHNSCTLVKYYSTISPHS